MKAGSGLKVSRETKERLQIYVDLLVRWNPRINLVSKSTISNVWSRHVADSAQIYGLAPHPVRHWADLGAGGGFPGLVVAIMAQESASPHLVTLVESDQRKSAFLRTVIRETGVTASVITDRIESAGALQVDVISARALSPLGTLLSYCERHLSENGTGLFHKGNTWQKELLDAQREWNFSHRVDTSQTDENAAILTISGVSRA